MGNLTKLGFIIKKAQGYAQPNKPLETTPSSVAETAKQNAMMPSFVDSKYQDTNKYMFKSNKFDFAGKFSDDARIVNKETGAVEQTFKRRGNVSDYGKDKPYPNWQQLPQDWKQGE